jgi:hypothetical protein
MMKRLLLIVSLIASVVAISALSMVISRNEVIHVLDNKRLQHKASAAFSFCKNNNLDTTYCILIDMRVHSGNNRMVVWDFATDKMIDQGMVSHGCCDLPWGSDMSKTNPLFSNVPDSHCSSLGKYKIGKRGYSQWGIHVNYKLHGLEALNSKAYDRFIVLHSWDAVPEEECFPNGTPEGWGCPAVSNAFMKRLDERLKNKSKDVLLWVFLDE